MHSCLILNKLIYAFLKMHPIVIIGRILYNTKANS